MGQLVYGALVRGRPTGEAVIGSALIEHVQYLRVEEVKRRLETSAVGVDEVGHEVGYEDASFFRRFFERLVGFTSSDYRRVCFGVGVAAARGATPGGLRRWARDPWRGENVVAPRGGDTVASLLGLFSAMSWGSWVSAMWLAASGFVRVLDEDVVTLHVLRGALALLMGVGQRLQVLVS